jgi:hypothetical protein
MKTGNNGGSLSNWNLESFLSILKNKNFRELKTFV